MDEFWESCKRGWVKEGFSNPKLYIAFINKEGGRSMAVYKVYKKNLQSLEDTQVRYTLEKYTLEKYMF